MLIVCRTLNWGMMFLSPVFLVRLLDMNAYGQYQEFLLYAMLLANFLAFSIAPNLLFFVARNEAEDCRYVTNTCLMTFITSTIGVAVIYCFSNAILGRTSIDFLLPLLFFLFFFVNFDVWESYWLAKRRSDYVLYYSSVRTGVRIAVVIAVAYVTRDVMSVIRATVVIEMVRFGFVFLFFTLTKRLAWELDFRAMKHQLSYIIPLGIASVIGYFNIQASKLYIAVHLGATFLAIYAIGSYQLPFLDIIRSSVGDVIFPDMAQRSTADRLSGLQLWKKANLIYCVLIFPLFAITFYYAELLIRVVFTSNYLASVPVFRIYLILMVRQCFEMSIPLRAINRNTSFTVVGIIGMAINLALLVLLFRWIGLVGPAVAFVVSDIAQIICLAGLILRFYGIGVRDLLMWRPIALIVGAALIGLPVLFLGDTVPMNDILRAASFSTLYLSIYCVTVYYLKIDEVTTLANSLLLRARFAVLQR